MIPARFAAELTIGEALIDSPVQSKGEVKAMLKLFDYKP
jgi:hypothetical protein